MKQLYAEKTANFPRLATDTFFVDEQNQYRYEGFMDDMIRFVESFHLLDDTVWRRFVEQFREDDADADSGWKCEFWGKMMRGAAFTYSYTKSEALYRTLTKTVNDMLDSQEADGRISSYAVSHELDAWDIWGRKYVLLGMQYFLEICHDDELKRRIIASMCKQVDAIMRKIGKKEDGKLPLALATHHWRGLNSCSLLEPIVRLYTLTGEQKYFDFATYIVDCGGTDVENIFDLAYENKLYPYQYPVTKAYEMTSCFEGLLEYYRHTKEEKYKTALIHFADRILESDFTIIGCCGCTHELFDHSTVRQANTNNGLIVQETCVTVTLMKFFYQLCALTGNSAYADAFETSLYNAYMGSVNTEKVVQTDFLKERFANFAPEPMPFDSYSPLTAGTRGNGIGGLQLMSDNHYYGCCACIGAAGFGLLPKMHLMTTENGFAMNLYINGTIASTTPSGAAVTFDVKTAYPKDGAVKIRLSLPAAEAFALKLRNPAWSETTSVCVNGEATEVQNGYIVLQREWSDGDEIELSLDMRTQAIRPIPYGHQILMTKVVWGHNYVVPVYDEEDPIAHKHIALRRGPIVFAQENRLGYSVDDPIEVDVRADGFVDVVLPETDKAPYPHIVEARVPLCDGSYMTVTDYASAGKLWNEESKMAAWMLTK